MTKKRRLYAVAVELLGFILIILGLLTEDAITIYFGLIIYSSGRLLSVE